MDLNSPLFDKIRIKRTCDEPKAAAKEGVCETPGCTNPGLYRAPKGRKAEGQYWRFCMDHVRAYNATYNYFDGMNDAAVEAYVDPWLDRAEPKSPAQFTSALPLLPLPRVPVR